LNEIFVNNSLRHFRNLKGLTQRELAAKVGFKPQTVASYEQYPRPLPDEFTEKAAKVLGVSVEELQRTPDEFLREKGVKYQSNATVETLPEKQLISILNDQAAQIAGSTGGLRIKLLVSIQAICEELKRKQAAS
jgi:transcriptional regulator with XRE-family HTH domain